MAGVCDPAGHHRPVEAAGEGPWRSMAVEGPQNVLEHGGFGGHGGTVELEPKWLHGLLRGFRKWRREPHETNYGPT